MAACAFLTAGAAAAGGDRVSGSAEEARAALVKQNGGTPQSEKAVKLALKWLAEHQSTDGSWNFDHAHGACKGRCPNKGTLADATTAATAMALLPFLGAGQSHKAGNHQKNVAAGLQWLVKQMKRRPSGGDLRGGKSMYSHGLAAMALCEAYGITKDKALKEPAQACLKFIAYAQDPVGGGWRYAPIQPGDTSVTGWQFMALTTGAAANLKIPKATTDRVSLFLNSVQSDGGAAYGYTAPGRGAATSAIGLLCRMHIGWKQDHPALEEGIRKIAERGLSKGNLYYDYYASQAMFHATRARGKTWEAWNEPMRDWLVSSQSADGHAAGSWYMNAGHAGRGGRLYCTSLAALMLEIYYRHPPIYETAKDDAAK